jgi:AraC-like DNA-binding protein
VVTDVAGKARGHEPLDYLVRWRVQLAARALRSTGRTVAAIGADLGYTSESAFSDAFKRITGQSPSHYRRPGHDAGASRASGRPATARPED